MDDQVSFIDISGHGPREQDCWPTVLVKKARIDAEIERLASIARPANGRRAAAINHPMNHGPVPSFAPATDVTIEVLKPGEESAPVARNSSVIDICLGGTAVATIGARRFATSRFDVWNTPAMSPNAYRNIGTDLFVRLSYSNAPLLEMLEVHYVDEQPVFDAPAADIAAGRSEAAAGGRRARDAAVPIDIGSDGAQLRGYEWLVDIDAVNSTPLLWPWQTVEPLLNTVYGLDKRYTGRHLYLLYNPATGRHMGTTPFHFATLAKFPPEKVDRPHRHTSASINYYMWGHGKSVVDKQRVEWEAGDLQFSAPGWVVHNHGARHQGFIALTVQDHPLHIAMESLLWQEELKGPVRLLGATPGFATNLDALQAA